MYTRVVLGQPWPKILACEEWRLGCRGDGGGYAPPLDGEGETVKVK